MSDFLGKSITERPSSYNQMKGRMFQQQIISVNARYDNNELHNRRKVQAAGDSEYIIHNKKAVSDNDVVAIQKNELVFTNNKSGGSFAMGIGSSAIPVLSNVNGLYVKKSKSLISKDKNEEIIKDEGYKCSVLGDGINFVGISLTEANTNVEHGNRPISTVSVQIGGTNTIINTGQEPIHAGQLVFWEVPTADDVSKRPKRLGLASEKAVLKTVPFNALKGGFKNKMSSVLKSMADPKINSDNGTPIVASDIFANKMKCLIHASMYLATLKNPTEDEYKKFRSIILGNSDYDTNVFSIFQGLEIDNQPVEPAGDAVNTIVSSIIDIFMTMQHSFDNHLVGRAVSSAKKGEEFDIYLNR